MTWILDHAEPDTGEREADEAVKMLGNYRSGTERALASGRIFSSWLVGRERPPSPRPHCH